MGECASKCFGIDGYLRKTSLRKVSHAFPAPILNFRDVDCSDKHNDKFYYLDNEDHIDKVISQLDECVVLSESDLVLLDKTLKDLKTERNRLLKFPDYDSGNCSTVYEEEEDMESSLIRSTSLQRPKKQSKHLPRVESKESLRHSLQNKEITQGTLVLEVQKAEFCHPQFLKRNNLDRPYVLVSFFFLDKAREKGGAKYNSKGVVIGEQVTNKAHDSINPGWDELVEHHFIDGDKKVSSYSFGFTLYYQYKRGNREDFQVGEEQIFSVGSLLDQKMQMKNIDFKEPEMNGLLARLKVRFQFLYDTMHVKERLFKDIAIKMERLIKIKRMKMITNDEKKESLSVAHTRVSARKVSEMSARSSNHEDNGETGYYIND